MNAFILKFEAGCRIGSGYSLRVLTRFNAFHKSAPNNGPCIARPYPYLQTFLSYTHAAMSS